LDSSDTRPLKDGPRATATDYDLFFSRPGGQLPRNDQTIQDDANIAQSVRALSRHTVGLRTCSLSPTPTD